jgi:hypothetical protein
MQRSQSTRTKFWLTKSVSPPQRTQRNSTFARSQPIVFSPHGDNGGRPLRSRVLRWGWTQSWIYENASLSRGGNKCTSSDLRRTSPRGDIGARLQRISAFVTSFAGPPPQEEFATRSNVHDDSQTAGRVSKECDWIELLIFEIGEQTRQGRSFRASKGFVTRYRDSPVWYFDNSVEVAGRRSRRMGRAGNRI